MDTASWGLAVDLHHRGQEDHRGGTEEPGSVLSGAIIGCGMKVHSALGPGLLESVYEDCLCHELSKAGLAFRRQVETPIKYGDFALSTRLRLDLMVEESVIVEVKAVETLLAVHEAQLLTYLRITGKRLGLLLNFNVHHFRHGIRRKIL
jgi:GxxExxY protein